MTEVRPGDVPNHVDIVGLEFGRLLILDVLTIENARRRDMHKAHVECSCGYRITVPVREILRGRTSRCFSCHSRYVERYGTGPERVSYTIADVQQMVTDRNAQRTEEAAEYHRAKQALGL